MDIPASDRPPPRRPADKRSGRRRRSGLRRASDRPATPFRARDAPPQASFVVFDVELLDVAAGSNAAATGPPALLVGPAAAAASPDEDRTRRDSFVCERRSSISLETVREALEEGDAPG